MRVLTPVVASLLALALLAGCQTLTGRTTGQYLDDKALAAAVKTRLVGEQASNLTRVDVDVVQDTVYLSGVVDTAEQRSRAEQVAASVEGVARVVNRLEVTGQTGPRR